MINMTRFIFCICLLLYAYSTAADASVAWIDSYDGVADDYTLVRSGQRQAVGIYVNLHVGDEISVEKSGELLICYADGSTASVNRENSPFIVESAPETSTVIGNVLAWIGNSLDLWSGEDKDRDGVTLHSRGDGLSEGFDLAFASDFPFKLVGGERTIAVSWTGGQLPYSVYILEDKTDGTSTVVFEASNHTENRIKTQPIFFSAGKAHRIIVSDSQASREIKLVIVDSKELPPFPQANELEALDEPLRTIIHASWLVREHSLFTFEAYQLLAGIAAESEPARLLMQHLETVSRKVR